MSIIPSEVQRQTFFDLPILVMVELSSGYILTEVESDDRTYSSWLEHIQSWWMQGRWHCHFIVSDGASSLIKLALEGWNCVSVADLFHARRALGKPLGSAIGRQYSLLKKQQQKLSEQLTKTTEQVKCAKLHEELEQLAVLLLDLESAQRTYHQAQIAITQAIHPFNLTTGDWQLWQRLSTSLCSPLEQLRSLAKRYGTNKASSGTLRFSQAKNGFLAYGVWVKRRRVSNGSKPARLGRGRPAQPHCGSVKGFDAILRLFFLKVPVVPLTALNNKFPPLLKAFMLGGAGESLALNAKTDDMQVQQWVVERSNRWVY